MKTNAFSGWIMSTAEIISYGIFTEIEPIRDQLHAALGQLIFDLSEFVECNVHDLKF